MKKDSKEDGGGSTYSETVGIFSFDVVQLEFDTIRTKPEGKKRTMAQRRNAQAQGEVWGTGTSWVFLTLLVFEYLRSGEWGLRSPDEWKREFCRCRPMENGRLHGMDGMRKTQPGT